MSGGEGPSTLPPESQAQRPGPPGQATTIPQAASAGRVAVARAQAIVDDARERGASLQAGRRVRERNPRSNRRMLVVFPHAAVKVGLLPVVLRSNSEREGPGK